MTARNPFKTALAERRPQIGLWLSMADPYQAEAAATCGYDWLLIDGEHAPNDLRQQSIGVGKAKSLRQSAAYKVKSTSSDA